MFTHFTVLIQCTLKRCFKIINSQGSMSDDGRDGFYQLTDWWRPIFQLYSQKTDTISHVALNEKFTLIEEPFFCLLNRKKTKGGSAHRL